MFRAGAHPGISVIWKRAARFCADRRGIAAVEFALIVPVLLIMYFVTMEASQAIEASKKVSRISSMVADLVTQQTSVVNADLTDIMKIGNSSLQPYNRSVADIFITAIDIEADPGNPTPKAKVAWSWRVLNGVTSRDSNPTSSTTVPATLNVAGTFLIRVKTTLKYEPIISWSESAEKPLGFISAFNEGKITMSETYYLRPRRATSIPCSNC
ncbi:pilus assembly protein [Mesorhizobium sp. M0761]|uniref:TadE/TadG family type IV pilus assembly protein n=1 Tax=unclassified Mesorhizobium TaxID=325217 RepID=UPI0033372D54